ncbi:glycosyltransferase [Acinetobacter radioresistens]|uniref:glycosyltransferase n=1 Tax=Acinetobacter radioresistens TaxID=40216 RepID=UPI0021CD343E|nr:glycosyltransferase [Acinetobacter radioresistens]MCU4499503.1 glycosyltransferase [Acinetobacter radioresistens]
MIRVLHIVGKMDRAGAETMLINLYRHIDRTQVQFDFVTFTTDQGDYDEEILALGGKIFPIIASNSIERMFKLTSFLKQHSEYQIVHAHMLLNNAFHLLAAKKAGIPHRISHSHTTSNGKSGIIAKLYEKFAIYLNKILSTKKIACGKEAAEYLFNTSKNVWLLNNAIDLKLYNEISLSNKNYWKTIKSDIQNLKIIQVGRLNEVKNHTFSLEIAKRLKEQDVDFTFFIVGQGPLEDLIRRKVQDYGLEENVFLLGVRNDVPSLMAGADVMLMPSLHEGFPVVLVEAQAIGLKSLISTNISTEVELVVGLVEFLDLNYIDDWISNLQNIKVKNANAPSNIKILSSQGFDIIQNSFELLNLYKSMSNNTDYVN